MTDRRTMTTTITHYRKELSIMTKVYYIHHIGYGPLTNHGEDDPLTFRSESEALQYLANCGEADNVGTEWEVRPLH